MKTEEEKNPFGKLEGIKTGWWLIIRCLQFMPIFVGLGVLFCYIIKDFSTPKTLAYLMSDDWLWWHRHSELFFCLFYGSLFVLDGILLWSLGFLMKKFPDRFREENWNIQKAADEVSRCGKGYFSVLVWVGLMGIMYFFVGV